MGENSSHAPGSAITNDGGMRQRHSMGMGGSPMEGGDFGVSEYPGRAKRSMNQPEGKMIEDAARGQKPTSGAGGRKMGTMGEVDHGPHDHHDAMKM